MRDVRKMVSLKSALLILLALLFFATGLYIFQTSARDCFGRKIEKPAPEQVEIHEDPDPLTTPVSTD